MSSLPEWAKNEEGNVLFNQALAKGADPGALLFERSALAFIAAKEEATRGTMSLPKRRRREISRYLPGIAGASDLAISYSLSSNSSISGPSNTMVYCRVRGGRLVVY